LSQLPKVQELLGFPLVWRLRTGSDLQQGRIHPKLSLIAIPPPVVDAPMSKGTHEISLRRLHPLEILEHSQGSILNNVFRFWKRNPEEGEGPSDVGADSREESIEGLPFSLGRIGR
jgi:hypothetical protein